jgi:MarR family transcriptional regulator, organic hydroperoxide resistance regulator
LQFLLELDERGEAAAGELAAAAELAVRTVTRMLDGLAAAGHVQRLRASHDGRVVLARLTESGRAQIAAKRDAWDGRWEQALAGAGSAELQAATAVLERLAAMFDEASAGPSKGAGEGPANTAATGRKAV